MKGIMPRSSETIRADIFAMIERIDADEKATRHLSVTLKSRLMEDLDGWNGCLGDERRCLMEELLDLFSPVTANDFIALIERATYGTDDEGDTIFRPDREYFYLNGYGNLVSTNRKEYDDFYDDYFDADEIAEHLKYFSVLDDVPELKALFEELSEALNA